MKKNFLHIILSFLLIIAVSDYIWYELLGDDQIAIELATETQEETQEDLRENRLSEAKHNLLDGSWIPNSQSFSFEPILSGVINYDGSNHPLANTKGDKLIIIYCQLRLPC